ncbi:MAG TPA: HAMP domain-containing protein, partial [Rectinemataceae bacterium]|nr:HAMP domain-containing protein [Rectinemataceae bacterium]
MRHGSRSNEIPRFRILGVVVPGLLLYLMLSLFFGFYFVVVDEVKRDFQTDARAVLDFAERHEQLMRSPHGATLALVDISSAGQRASLDLAALAVILGLGSSYAYHAPLLRFFARARRGRPIPGELIERARRRAGRSPGVLALAVPAFVLPLGVLRLCIGAAGYRDAMMLPIEAVSLALSSLFTFLWQRHRLQILYLPRLFSREELSTRMPGGHRTRVRGDLFLLVSLSTVLPILVIGLFVGTSISFAGTLSSLSPDQLQLLFGADAPRQADFDLQSPGGAQLPFLDPSRLPVYFMGPLDVARTVSGLVLGLSILLVYVFFIARWTAADIVLPVQSLRANMSRAREGDLAALTPALTTNELGELTLGFNDMLRGLAERERIKVLFGQYLTKEISEAILDG